MGSGGNCELAVTAVGMQVPVVLGKQYWHMSLPGDKACKFGNFSCTKYIKRNVRVALPTL